MASQATAFETRCAANDEDPAPMLHRTVLSLVRREGADLTARQLAVFLTVYLDDGPHTVRGLAALLNICKPAVTRALDRLEELDLARRGADPRDRRSVLVRRTDLGRAYLGEVRLAMDEAASAAAAVRRAAAARPQPRAWPKAVPARRTGYGHGFAATLQPG